MTSPVMYLSGPISNSDPAQLERNIQAFVDAAAALRAHGLTVVSPVELCPERGMPWVWYMKRCVAALAVCDRIVLMPGWRDSRGARMEYDIAVRLGLAVRPIGILVEPSYYRPATISAAGA